MHLDASAKMQELLLKRLGEIHELISAQSIISGAILGALSVESPIVVEQVAQALRAVVSESASPVLNSHLNGFLDGMSGINI